MSGVIVQRAVPARGIPAPRTLRRYARAGLGPAKGEVTIRIVGPAESRALNARYRRKDKPTNVLSFRYDRPHASRREAATLVFGDLVICAAVVAREARKQGKALKAHWAHMVVHGCLHLLGFDHERAADAKTMEARERNILATLGFSDPYA